MPKMFPDEQETAVTGFHREVSAWLEASGFGLQDEVDLPPYRVDIYLPDFHAAVEADGPTHGRTMDGRRDAYLKATYFLPVFHVPLARWRRPNHDGLGPELAHFLHRTHITRNERWLKAKDRLPWI